jgi:hypothetical protein
MAFVKHLGVAAPGRDATLGDGHSRDVDDEVGRKHRNAGVQVVSLQRRKAPFQDGNVGVSRDMAASSNRLHYRCNVTRLGGFASS